MTNEECYECALYSGTDKAPPPHDHPDNRPRTAAGRLYVERLRHDESNFHHKGPTLVTDHVAEALAAVLDIEAESGFAGTYAEVLASRDAITEDYNALSDEHDKCAESAERVSAAAQEYFEASLPLLNGYPLTSSESLHAWERLREANTALRVALMIETRSDE